MDTIKTEELLRKMFYARRVTLLAGAVLLGLGIAGGMLPVPWYLILGPLDEVVFTTIAAVMLCVITVGSIVTWHYAYFVSLQEGGFKYAVGHLLICMVLTPPALLGIIFIPLQIFNDIDRWRQNLGDSCDPLNLCKIEVADSASSGIGESR